MIIFKSLTFLLILLSTIVGCDKKDTSNSNQKARHYMLTCVSDEHYRAVIRLVEDNWKYFNGFDVRHVDTFAIVFDSKSHLMCESKHCWELNDNNEIIVMSVGLPTRDLQPETLSNARDNVCKVKISEDEFKFLCESKTTDTSLVIDRANLKAVYGAETSTTSSMVQLQCHPLANELGS